jgi:GST-like protein
LDKRLEGREYILGDEYTVADMACMPWVVAVDKGYAAAAFLRVDEYANVNRWMKRLLQRSAVRDGMRVLTFGLKEFAKNQTNSGKPRVTAKLW